MPNQSTNKKTMSWSIRMGDWLKAIDGREGGGAAWTRSHLEKVVHHRLGAHADDALAD